MFRIPRTARAIGSAVLSVLAFASSPASRAADELIDVRVSLPAPTVAGIELRSAIEKGIFAKHGLRLNLNVLASGTENIAAVVGGSADIAYTDTFAALHGLKNGFDLTLVASNNGTSQHIFYLVPADSPIREPKEFANRSIGLGAVPFWTVFAKAFLQHHGVDPESVKLTIVRQPAALGEALAGKRVDAIQTSSAISALQWKSRYGFRQVGSSDTAEFQNPKASQAGWWTTKKWARENAATAQKFADALRETNNWYVRLSREEQAEHIKRYTKIDLVELEKQLPGALEVGTRRNLTLGPIDVPATRSWIAIGNRYAGVPADIDLDAHIFKSAR